MSRSRPLLLAAVLALAGCSIAFVRGPDAPDFPGGCTRKPLLPVIDAYGGLAATALGLGAGISALIPGDRNRAPVLGLAAGLIVTGILFRVSSIVGFRRVTRCNKAVRTVERREDPNEVDLNP